MQEIPPPRCVIVVQIGDPFHSKSLRRATAAEPLWARAGALHPDTLFVCDRCTLSDMVVSAFHILPDQISGPAWLDGGDRFTISAKVPSGTTPEQLRPMQQHLLEERFNLKWHREEKLTPVSELVIAKGGPKMKSSTGEPSGSREPGASVEPR